MLRKLLQIAIVLLCIPAYAGVIERYVNTGSTAGGDGTTNATAGANRAYPSLGVGLTSEIQDLTDNGGDILRFNCVKTGDANDTTQADPNAAYTQNSSCYIEIIGTDFPADGIWDDNAYTLSSTNTAGLFIHTEYVRVKNVQFEVIQSGSGAARGISVPDGLGTSAIYVEGCIFKGRCSGTGSGYGIRVLDGSVTLRVWNSIFYGFVSGTSSNFKAFESTVINTNYFYNCTVFNCRGGLAINNTSATLNAYNCVVCNTANDFYQQDTVDYCATDDGDGDNKQDFTAEATDWAKVFNNYAAGDFSLKDYTTSPCLVDTGMSDPASGLYSTDITGKTRPIGAAWDIGAFEYGTEETPETVIKRPRAISIGMD